MQVFYVMISNFVAAVQATRFIVLPDNFYFDVENLMEEKEIYEDLLLTFQYN